MRPVHARHLLLALGAVHLASGHVTPFATAVFPSAVLAECARRWPSPRWLYAALLASLVAVVVPLYQSPTHVAYVIEYVPTYLLSLVLVPALERHRAPAFAAGAAFASALTWHPAPMYVVFLYFFVRDVGTTALPWRAHFTQAMSGILAIYFAHCIAHDIQFAYFAAYPQFHWYGIVDSAWTYVPRVCLEFGVILAAQAHARGRTSSVIALALIAPTLALLMAHTGHVGITTGCFGWEHPLAYNNELVVVVYLLAIAPWVWPMMRACKRTGLRP